MLLGSPPDMVHSRRSRRTNSSTQRYKSQTTQVRPSFRDTTPAAADFRYRAPLLPRLVWPYSAGPPQNNASLFAKQPTARSAYVSISYFRLTCKCYIEFYLAEFDFGWLVSTSCLITICRLMPHICNNCFSTWSIQYFIFGYIIFVENAFAIH